MCQSLGIELVRLLNWKQAVTDFTNLDKGCKRSLFKHSANF